MSLVSYYFYINSSVLRAQLENPSKMELFCKNNKTILQIFAKKGPS